MRNQRTTRRRTFSVSVARSAWVIGRAGNCLRQAACPQQGRRPVAGRHEDAVGRAHMQVHVVIERRSEAVQKGDGAEPRASLAWPVAVTGRGHHRELLPIVAAPANVFDLIAGCRLEAWSSFIDPQPAEHSSLASKARRLCGRLERLFRLP